MGLLDYLNSPAGMGLLSAAAGYAAGARRGQPVNSLGRGALAGLTGYAQANDQLRMDEENKFMREYKQMQMDEARRQAELRKQQYEWKAGLPQVMAPKLSGTTDQGRMLADQSAAFGDEGARSLVDSAMYAKPDAPLGVQYGMDRNAVNQYMMRPESPFADKLIEQQLFPKEEEAYTLGAGQRRYKGDKMIAEAPARDPEKDRLLQMMEAAGINPESEQGRRVLSNWIQKQTTHAPATSVNVNGFPKETFKNERDLRNDFQGLPTTKAFREVEQSYDQIKAALKTPGAASSLTAATKFMKLLDPGSVVRESELGMAMAATGQLDRMTNLYNKWRTGDLLTPAQRADFEQMADQLYAAAAERYNASADEYRTMAQDYQLNPDRIAKPSKLPTRQTVSDVRSQADAILGGQ